jgi:nicotinamidase-related amidase
MMFPIGTRREAVFFDEGYRGANCRTDPWPIQASSIAEKIRASRQSAAYGTELDLQLPRRGIENVIIGGVMTNFGVESTARNA